MNRFKKELRKRGYELSVEQNCDWLQTTAEFESIKVDAEHALYIQESYVWNLPTQFDRQMHAHQLEPTI